jgi:P4 family phage/plasmid primase-like protien
MDEKLYDLSEIRKAIGVLFADVKCGAGECIEVRMFDKNKNLVVAGWFDNPDIMAKRIALAARDGVRGDTSYKFIQDNIYWTINPVNDALLSRQPKNTLQFVKDTTSDNNITRRCWLPFDVDPIRPSGVSATKQERALARDVINDIFLKLEEMGFTENMYVGGTSGNGYHCVMRIDLPNDDDSRELLRDCLKGLNTLVGTAKVDIDLKVFNAARILKAYGTIARKGVNDAVRPWRLSKLVHVPEHVEVAPRELLAKLADIAPKGNNPRRAIENRPQGPWAAENTQKYIDKGTDWDCIREDGGKSNEVCRWKGNCVLDDNHKDAVIILHTDGWWSYGCFHSSCSHFQHEQFKAFWAERKGKYKYPTIREKLSSIVAEGLSKGFNCEEFIESPESPKEIPLYNLTDAGNMERLVWRYKNTFLYCPQRDWFAWDGSRWQPDATRAITGAALATVRKIVDDELDRTCEGYDTHTEEGQKKIGAIENAYREWQKGSESRMRLTAMIELAESFIPLDLKQFDSDNMLFNCANGTIDLRTGEVHEHRRENYLTNISPVEYDPSATCPLWLSFLGDVTAGNDELIRYLQRAIGYSLTGLTVEHCMFLLYGTGRNGKSTFLEVIRHLMGGYGKVAHMGSFLAHKFDDNIPNDLAMLHASRFVFATESDDGKRLAESKIKQITGGDTISARFLRKEFFEFRPQFKIWLGTNYKPTIYGTDEGIWRRIKLIPFNVYIPDSKMDETLTGKLKSESSGILNWALQGLDEYRRNGMMEPSIVTASTDEYRGSQDWMTRFLEEVTEPSTTDSVRARKLYETYVNWCDKTGEYKLKEQKFAEGMQQKGRVSRRKKFKDALGKEKINMMYEGLKLRDTLSGFEFESRMTDDVY